MSSELLIRELRNTRDVHNILFANQIETSESHSISSSNTSKCALKLQIRAYQLFLDLLDPECKEKLINIDRDIATLSSLIVVKSGWWRCGKDFKYQSHSPNKQDSSFRCFDTYRVCFTPYGYVPFTFNHPYNAYFSGIREVEVSFLKKNEKELEKLHKAFLLKDTFMNGNYSLQDDSSSELASEICRYLGYSQEDKCSKTYCK